ncbi:MAG: hypothetical protein IK999_11475 [Ruminococcus sp.]|nr:hypothetical protein [Ruminococcus sp.]
MKQFRFLDNVKTPDDWKRRALDIKEAEKPKLRGWQYGTAVAAAAVVAISAGILPNVIKKGGITNSPSSYIDEALTDDESVTEQVQNDLLAQLEQEYDEVVVGTVISSGETADGKMTIALAVRKIDYDGGSLGTMLEAVAVDNITKLGFGPDGHKLVTGDKVAIGLEKMRNNIDIKLNTENGIQTMYFNAFENLREFGAAAYLGDTDDTEFLSMLETAKAASNDDYSYITGNLFLSSKLAKGGTEQNDRENRTASIIMNNFLSQPFGDLHCTGTSYEDDSVIISGKSRVITDLEDPEYFKDSMYSSIPQLFVLDVTSKTGRIEDISLDWVNNEKTADIEMKIDGKSIYAQAVLSDTEAVYKFSRVRFVKDMDDSSKAYLLINAASTKYSEDQGICDMTIQVSDKPFGTAAKTGDDSSKKDDEISSDNSGITFEKSESSKNFKIIEKDGKQSIVFDKSGFDDEELGELIASAGKENVTINGDTVTINISDASGFMSDKFGSDADTNFVIGSNTPFDDNGEEPFIEYHTLDGTIDGTYEQSVDTKIYRDGVLSEEYTIP